jgi:hypothetical protein
MTKRTATRPKGKRFELPYNFPYYSQFSSPELVLDIIRGRVRAEDDPRRREFGADSGETYAHWSWKACGIACLKMAVEALGGPVRPMMSWIEAGLAIGGFLAAERAEPGKPSGWVHKALVEPARGCGLDGECRAPAGLDDIVSALDAERVVIASVSHELGEWGDIKNNRGHLVVVRGYSRLENRMESLLVNNPSGRYRELRENCWLPALRFEAGFSGRIIVLFRRA